MEEEDKLEIQTSAETEDMVSEKHGEESSKYEVLDYTFRFLADFNEEPELNPVLAGYFSKLIACLLKHKKFEL